MFKILIGVVVVAIAVISAFMIIDPKLQAETAGTVTEVANSFTVAIEGEVYKTGNFTMKEGSTMIDLIETAGGTTVNADSRAYYEEALLTKGMTYFIASRYDSSDICSASEVSKVNINVDDAETLTTVSGITSTLANSIITYRESNGIFATLEELMEVYGIGNATYRKIRNYVILHA
jgi:competence protein ComEA